jgi:TonB family protein
LHAESRGESLVLSWNRRNPVVAASSGAVLTITDGRKHFERSLDPDLVAEGVVSYRPVTGDVTFQLRVTGADQTIAFGKLRVLDANSPASSDAGKPVLDLNKPTTAESSAANSTTTTQSPASQPGSVTPQLTVAASTEPPHTPSAQTNNTGVKLPAANPPLTGTVKRPVETYKQAQTAKQVPNQPSQQEKLAQSASQQPTSTTPVPVISAPKPVASHSNTNSTASTISPQTSNTAINGWDPNLPENKPAAQQSQQQTGPPDSKTIDFIGPKVLLQVMPNPRSLTPGLVSEVTRVEVELRIDTTGHVKAAHLTNPNVKSQLGAASIAAAKQWTFQPASLRGQHVESDHTIVFEFRPEGL